ncbi:unnamed protein product (macronuclear) [Paramecium tetraurelia]|uniref:Uncharacterized protein n=1 Tax=Paramecium tetraurelia TaxID=5888 RepID=A0E5H6_PARTE|nr:uncharacterized protein GSPATT00003404001 [Paramecium tetraurelia]CAK90543.1 unnamed protein product [Paramecium tetraurelia]|eukprot:XP_001457940.1 hypothetical protein (macronuclear) [Paramecium tetraurelia strain d4-2]
MKNKYLIVTQYKLSYEVNRKKQLKHHLAKKCFIVHLWIMVDKLNIQQEGIKQINNQQQQDQQITFQNNLNNDHLSELEQFVNSLRRKQNN